MLFFIFITEMIIIVIVVIILTWLLSNFNFKVYVSFCWFASVQPQKKVFLRDHNGNKFTQLFCVIPAIAPQIFFLFSILHYSSVFDCKFICKSYVSIEFIFLMVKDTHLLMTCLFKVYEFFSPCSQQLSVSTIGCLEDYYEKGQSKYILRKFETSGR